MHFKAIFSPFYEGERKNKKQQIISYASYLLFPTVIRKILLTMKLTTILLISTCLQVSAEGFSQTVTLSEHNAPLKKVFTEIGKQTGYVFFGNESLFERTGKVTIKLKDADLHSVLDICLKDQGLTYSIIGSNIVIKEKEKIPYPVVIPVPDLFVDIKGRVFNEEGEPLVGATVTIKGTQVGTSTDASGNFSINATMNATLVISYVGHSPVEVVVKKQDIGTITLRLSAENINEQVVVVGYGAVQRKNLTASVSSVKSSDVVKSTETSLNSALQGRAAGVDVISSEGGPAPTVSITIRGGSSISASNEPLYVINGFPQLGGSNLNINVNDIESIDIIKDAAAAAYGSRGANGVVLITTKSGKAGKFSVNYDGYVNTQHINNQIAVMNAGQYAELQHFLRRGGEYGDTTMFKNWQNYADSPSINWQDRIMRTPLGQSHNLSMSGGTDKVKILTSFGYFNQPGIIIGTKYDRYTANFNIRAKFNKLLSNETTVYLAQGEKSGPEVNGSAGPTFSAIKAAPFIGSGFETLSDFLSENLGFGGVYGVDPVVELSDPELKRTTFNGNLNTAFTFHLTEHLNLRVSGGLSKGNSEYKSFYPSTTSSGRISNGSAYISMNNSLNWLNENTLNYSNTFKGIHDLDATLGFSMQKSTSNDYGFGSRNFDIQTLGYDYVDLGSVFSKPSSNKVQSQLMSYFGIVRYSLLDRYLFSVIMRADGSSKFPNSRWGYFPFASFGWKVSEEPFFKDLSRNVSQLKLRLSYGQTGNESVPPYSSLLRFSSIWNTNDNAGGLVPALAPVSFGVGDLKWETNIQTNIGIDLGLFKDRILITADAYKKQSKNLLLAAKIAWASGYKSVYKNVGDIQVQGLEFNVNTQNIRGKLFSWNTNFNIAFTKGRVNRLTDDAQYFYAGGNADLFIVKVGDRLGGMYGFLQDGIYNTHEELYNGPTNSVLVVTAGARRYKDLSGPDGKPDGIVDAAYDRTILGNGNPKFTGGFNNEFRLGPVDLSFLFTFVYGNSIMNKYEYYYMRPSTWQGGPEDLYNYHWTNQNPQINELLWSGAYDNEYTNLTSYQIQDGSYMRLKNLMLGYNLPVSNFPNWGLTKLRVYVSAQNLLTFTRYRGFDPEVNYYSNLIQPGVDWGSYPRSKIITFGLNVGF